MQQIRYRSHGAPVNLTIQPVNRVQLGLEGPGLLNAQNAVG